LLVAALAVRALADGGNGHLIVNEGAPLKCRHEQPTQDQSGHAHSYQSSSPLSTPASAQGERRRFMSASKMVRNDSGKWIGLNPVRRAPSGNV
jgi:hypothetical protein